MSTFTYVGEELDVFALAKHWKTYVRSSLGPSIGGNVLEVGAGIGSTTQLLCGPSANRWVCLEPDAGLADRLANDPAIQSLQPRPEVAVGFLNDLATDDRFDTILYIDVLEHIEDDRGELERASARLQPGGNLIVLCPAHQFLFTEFDRRVGHFRRYSKRSLRAVGPEGLDLQSLFYLDAVGMLVSLGNRCLLRQGKPTARQVRLWDNLFVRTSRLVDPLLRWSVGKTVVAVWQAPALEGERPRRDSRASQLSMQ